jgi:hypothetical protein
MAEFSVQGAGNFSVYGGTLLESIDLEKSGFTR